MGLWGPFKFQVVTHRHGIWGQGKDMKPIHFQTRKRKSKRWELCLRCPACFRKWQVFSSDAEATVPWRCSMEVAHWSARHSWGEQIPGSCPTSNQTSPHWDFLLVLSQRISKGMKKHRSALRRLCFWHWSQPAAGLQEKCNPLMRNQKWNFSNKSQEHMVAVWHFVVRDDMESWFNANRVTLTSGILAQSPLGW